MCHDGPRCPGRRWQEPEQELGQPGFLSGTPAPTVQWPRGVILGRSAVSCCRLDEMGNCPCFRRVSPRVQREWGPACSPSFAWSPRQLSFAPAGPLYISFTAERKPKSLTASSSLCDWPGLDAGVFCVWPLVQALGKSERGRQAPARTVGPGPVACSCGQRTSTRAKGNF